MHRSIQIIVPFKLNEAKSRLASVLMPEERRLVAFSMLKDVLNTVLGFGSVTILSRPGLKNGELHEEVNVLESDLELNGSLNAFIEKQAGRGWPYDILIVMADLALLTKEVVKDVLVAEGDVVLCPGRYGGTNMILIRNPKFRTCYQGLSFPKHLAFARDAGLKIGIFESFRAGCDIDEPDDLAEVLLHGQGETKKLLEQMGFALSENGRGRLEKR